MSCPDARPGRDTAPRAPSRDAARDGTGMPSPSLWVGACDVENPSAPSSSDRATIDAIAPTCSSVAAVPHGLLADHGAPHRRVADEEPGVHGHGTIEPAQPFAECGPRPVEMFERGDRHALDSGHHARQVLRVLDAGGRGEKPQLPPITVVTPCSGEGLAVGSHDSWAS